MFRFRLPGSGISAGRRAARDERLKWNIQEKLKSGVKAAKSGGDGKSESFKINGKPVEFTPIDQFCIWPPSPAQDRQPTGHIEKSHQGSCHISPCRGAEQAPGVRHITIDEVAFSLQKR